MSDADSFIQEVTEEVRRDRMFRLWRRYGPVVIAAIVALVVAAAVVAWLDHRREQAAREAGGALLEAVEAADPARRGENLIAAADALEDGPAAAARLRAAAEFAAAGATDDALAAYRAVAEDTAVERPLAALAGFRAAVIESGRADPGAAAALLAPHTAEGAPFRLLALEARAVAHMRADAPDAARADLDAILADPGATESLRQRAAELLTTLGPAES